MRAEATRKESEKLERILGLANIPTMLEAAQQHRSGFTKFDAVVQVIAQGAPTNQPAPLVPGVLSRLVNTRQVSSADWFEYAMCLH